MFLFDSKKLKGWSYNRQGTFELSEAEEEGKKKESCIPFKISKED